DPSVSRAVGDFKGMVDEYAGDDPASLLGVLYVLEGSTMGGSMMKPRIAKQLGLTSGSGLNYYGCYGHQVRARFDDFKSRMGTAVDGSGAEPRVLEAARNTFDRVGAVLRAIVPE
ncbi:MAG: biliverdin-producing heme oxygenase, partial [Planctomycetota bacterium]|nr:biliverdin-producing heme oxygenase [Planctomycetota bacterium]